MNGVLDGVRDIPTEVVIQQAILAHAREHEETSARVTAEHDGGLVRDLLLGDDLDYALQFEE